MTRIARFLLTFVVGGSLLLSLSCRHREEAVHLDAPIVLRDATRESGITFRHTDGSCGRNYMPETMSAGLALFDYDGDGLIDIYLLNGAPLPGKKVDPAPTNALYRNLGEMHFADVTEQAGVGDRGYGLGTAAGDYDNDGDIDLFVNNFGPNVLYRNQGDGTFVDVTAEAGLDGKPEMGAGACFLDMDSDGDLDLYVANYVDFAFDNHVVKYVDGVAAYASPLDYFPVADTLFRNNGNGTFSDVSLESGIAGHHGTGMGMICADYDADGDTDILVANDEMRNFVFQNDGKGVFREVGLACGLAYDENGESTGTMGVDCGDYDNDGRSDFYATSYAGEWATLHRNVGNGTYRDVTRMTGAGAGTLPHVTWGIGFADFDNDGDRDLYVARGNFQKSTELVDRVTVYEATNLLLMNSGDGKFIDVTEFCGEGLSVKHSSRGAAFDDLDNDGDIDVVVLNSRQVPTVLRNDSPSDNHWLQVRLQGAGCNRDGVGSQVRVVAGDLSQIAEVHSGRGYQSHWGTRLHFGLGKHDRVDRLEVAWLGGGTDVLENVRPDQLVTVVEGESLTMYDRPVPRGESDSQAD